MQHDLLQGRASRPVFPILLLAGLAALLMPPLVFMIVAIAEGMGFGAGFSALIEQYQTQQQNLGMLGALGLIPLLLLSVVVWLLRFVKRLRAKRRRLAAGGAIAILAVLAWVNLQFWPVFLPNQTYPGFPHGLEFVIGAFIFAPIAMVAGMLIAGFTGQRSDLR